MYIIQMLENSGGFFLNIHKNNYEESYIADANIASFLKISLNDFLECLIKIGGSVDAENGSRFEIKQKEVKKYIDKFKEEFSSELILAELECDSNV